ncbi:MAG: hypothetical protein ACRC5C_10925 [Bacilli bacterium]
MGYQKGCGGYSSACNSHRYTYVTYACYGKEQHDCCDGGNSNSASGNDDIVGLINASKNSNVGLVNVVESEDTQFGLVNVNDSVIVTIVDSFDDNTIVKLQNIVVALLVALGIEVPANLQAPEQNG